MQAIRRHPAATEPPVQLVVIGPETEVGTVFSVKSIPRIGESIRVKEKRYRIKTSSIRSTIRKATI
ncbi:MAG: hypothetical protein H0X34_10475 [Chthoniobacterales bacterium]|jgi:hypothetical protein|nr:hypothetical protein [Chthoniobacterales bacterium]